MKVEFYKHNLDKEEKSKLLKCIDGIFLTAGAYVTEFEHRFADYMSLNYCVGLNSCTAGLHLALTTLGLGPGDEVITTPMTFIATATAIMHTGAKPVFVDVDPQTGLIDPHKIEAAVTKKTRAIVPVHLYGQMCDMTKIRQIADTYNLKIVEDAAHCIEGQRDGVRPGYLSDAACFSFYATKSITSGEGGAVATNDQNLAQKIRILRQHGMSKEAADRYTGNYQHWDMVDCGWKYNMDNIQAALLLPQLLKIDSLCAQRKRIHNTYVECLKGFAEIATPNEICNSKNAYHLFTIWVDKSRRDEILKRLGDHGIGVAVNYRAIHLLTYMRHKYGFHEGQFPNAENIGARTISLPLYSKLTDVEVNYVIQTTKKILPSVEVSTSIKTWKLGN